MKSNFNFNGKAMFLTYKSHISSENLLNLFGNKYKTKFAAVHESSDKSVSYDHTHVLVWFLKKTHVRNCRAFDIKCNDDVIHPHIKIIKSRTHWQNEVMYIRKQNEPFLNSLTGNEYEFLGSYKDLIQSKRTWAEVINDDYLVDIVKKYLNWAKEVFEYRPKENFSADIKLRPWQEKVIDELSNQNDREIMWIYDPQGGNGKSTLTNYLIDMKEAFFFNGGRSCDIAHAYSKQLSEIVVVDLPKSHNEDFKTPYKIMECFKDGRLTSSKYNSKTLRFKKCKVVVFSNERPDKSRLIADRWNIYKLTHGTLERVETDGSGVSLTLKVETPEIEKVEKTSKKKKVRRGGSVRKFATVCSLSLKELQVAHSKSKEKRARLANCRHGGGCALVDER